MPRKKKIQILSDCSNVTARFLKYFGTAVINAISIEQLFLTEEEIDGQNIDFIVCASLAGVAGVIETLSCIYGNHSKKIEKIHKGLLKSERFLDFIMFFRGLHSSIYFFSGQKYLAIAVAGGITLPFASWRTYKSKRYWIENPLTLFLAKNLKLKDVELGTFPLPRQVFSHRFSIQGFSEFKSLHNAATNSASQTDSELLREYFNTQMAQYHFFNRYVLMDSLTYGAEIATIVSYIEFNIHAIWGISNPVLNFGISALFFIAGVLVGYKIEKIKNLLFDIYTSDFTRDQGLQDDIHELLIKLYANVTVNIRRFAKVAEFLKNMLSSFIGLQFAYVALSDGVDVPDVYAGTTALFSILVGINSIYNVQRQQDEMLAETGVKNALERLEKSESGAVVETEYVTPAAQVQTITTPPKGEKSDATGQPLPQGNGSPESSVASSSDSDSPPRSLPSRSPPPPLERTEEASSVRSAPDDLLMTRREVTHKKPRGWFDGWSSFFSSKHSERGLSLRAPLMPPDERERPADPELANGMMLKPA